MTFYRTLHTRCFFSKKNIKKLASCIKISLKTFKVHFKILSRISMISFYKTMFDRFRDEDQNDPGQNDPCDDGQI